MIKYLMAIAVGVVLVLLAIFLLRSTDPEKQPEATDDEFVTAIQDRSVNPGDDVEPQMVKVTLGDSLYHAFDCSWIGKLSKRMTKEKAEELGFEPCEQCME